MIKTITTLIVIFSWLFSSYTLTAQELVAVFGQEIQWQDIRSCHFGFTPPIPANP